MGDRLVGFAVKSLSNELRRNMERYHCRSGEITGMQCGILDFVYRNQGDGDIFQKDIEAKFNIRGSTATGILSLMEKNGYIIRKPVSHDARLKKIVLTDKAVAKQKEIFAELNKVDERLIKGLSQEDISNFFRIIDTMMSNMDSKNNYMEVT